MKVITIGLQKGGTGKTTTAFNLASGMVREGKRVLVIDLDSQCSITMLSQALTSGLTSYDVLIGKCSIKKAIQKGKFFDIISGSQRLSRFDSEDLKNPISRLKIALLNNPLDDEYDYIIIDTPPQTSMIVNNALTVSDGLIVPCQAEILSLQGLEQIVKTVKAIKEETNPKLRILGILVTMYNAHTIVHTQILPLIKQRADNLGTVVYSHPIRLCTAIGKSQAERRDVFTERSNAKADYTQFVKEVLEQLEGENDE